MIQMESLWGEEFKVDDLEKAKKILGKVNKPKKIDQMDPEKVLASKTIGFEDKLKVTTENVYRILGHYKDETICLYGREELHRYIDSAIKNGVIAIDTETLGTRTDIAKAGTDPLTCRIAGLCLYTPGEKNAYIPVNHVDYKTGERIEGQCTEEDIKEELQRIVDARTQNIYHNGKFDYMVLYYTCGIKVPISWDTMIGAQILDENERAGLKFQYRDKINPEQEKYDLDKLFDLNYTDKYPIDLFSLYAATDSMMTYKLYLYQKGEYEKKGNERLYNLFYNIEMPVVTVTAEMEMRGIAVDKEFAERLSKKFHKRLDDLNNNISKEMDKYKKVISEWRLTPEANYTPTINGRVQKSLSEKLSDPVELTSPTQLSILLYDVLHVLKVGKKDKRSVDEAALLSLKDTLPLAGMILKMREYEKYLGTYIDVLPTYCSPRDGRVHAHFNQLGREDRNVVTGRMSSSDPSLQVIPARGDIVTVRSMFTASTEYNEYEAEDLVYINKDEEVLLNDGQYRWAEELKPGDILDGGTVLMGVKELEDRMALNF